MTETVRVQLISRGNRPLGYSLPDDDVEVVYLLKRGLAHITDPKKITVIESARIIPTSPSATIPSADVTGPCSARWTGTPPV
jgi:hypothetical protein